MTKTHTISTPGRGVSLDRFLSPEAMLTPGAAGGVIVVISNALAANFSLPKAQVGLALSFVFGLLAMTQRQQWYLKATYYLLNSLIIFCVAFGAGSLTYSPEPAASGHALVISPAYADEPAKPSSEAPPTGEATPSAPARSTSNPPASRPATTEKGWNNPLVGPCSVFNNPLGKNC